jgi:hypothetical protein
VAFLYVWLGSIAKGTLLEWIPFSGLVESREWQLKRQSVVIAAVVVPALMFAGLALAAIRRHVRRVELAYLLTNVLLFVVLLHRLSYGDGYTSVGRVVTGVILAAVLCIPWLWPLGTSARPSSRRWPSGCRCCPSSSSTASEADARRRALRLHPSSAVLSNAVPLWA